MTLLGIGAHHHARRRVPFVAIAPGSTKSATEQFHQLVSAVAGHTAVVVDAQAKGSLTHAETMEALRRQARDLLTAIALLDAKERP
jgi:hypothetical protein